MKYNCLIVDDEPLARRVVEKHLSHFDDLNLVAQCSNAFEAIKVLKKHPIDILFLDINMPKLSGINFLKTLKQPPLVIFTTAYPEYAVEGFELEALDYLLKPFSLERFTKSIFKAIQQLEVKEQLLFSSTSTLPSYILIKADKRLHKIKQTDILYLEAYGDYVKIFIKNLMLLPKKKLTELNKSLDNQLFIQIHRSYIVNTTYIEYIEGNQLKVSDKILPISQSFKSSLLEYLKEKAK